MFAIGVPMVGTSLGFQQELLLRRTLQHPNLLALVGVCSQNRPPMLFYEWPDKGCLRGYLTSQKLGTILLLQMSLDVSLGMEFLAGQSMVRSRVFYFCTYISVYAIRIVVSGNKGINLSKHKIASRWL